jgi:hypothetical protein
MPYRCLSALTLCCCFSAGLWAQSELGAASVRGEVTWEG